jgi:negative regulator of sigma E activity
MTPDFESWNNSDSASFEDSSSDSPLGILDTQKRDRFELLSAYLDGEVTAAERRQVQDWLATEPQVQCLYKKLLKMRGAFTNLPIPQEISVEQTVEGVFAKLDRSPSRVFRWGGVAIAAAVVGALATIVSTQNPFSPQYASGETVKIALNTPLVDISNTNTIRDDKSLQQPMVNLQQSLITTTTEAR